MSPSSIEVRLLSSSPGPQVLGKLAQDIRQQNSIADPQLLLRMQDFDRGRRRRASERIDQPLVPWVQGQALQKTIFEAVRKKQISDVHFRTAAELMEKRNSFQRHILYAQANNLDLPDEELNRLVAELNPLAENSDLRIAAIQYSEALIDDFLTTVMEYAAFWARPENARRSRLPESSFGKRLCKVNAAT